jgi:hypothetical protein
LIENNQFRSSEPCQAPKRYEQIKHIISLKVSESKNISASKKIQTWLVLTIIIAVCGYNVFNFIKEKKEKEAKEAVWTQKDYIDLVQRCVQDTGDRGKEFPEITTEYCECSTKLITSAITKKEYLFLVQQSFDVQSTKLTPLFKNCLDDYLAKVIKLENQRK